jgi:paraquat-inducible protein A
MELPAPQTPLPPETSMVCHACDAAHTAVPLKIKQVARCSRCQAVLGRSSLLSISGQLAFTIAAGLFLLIGNCMPLVELELRGIHASLTLPQAIALTWSVGQPLVASLAAAIAVLFPLALVALRLYVLWPLTQGKIPAGFGRAMHALHLCIEWSMVEVFLLSTLVAIVRSSSIAIVKPGIGLLAYVLVTLLLTALTAAGLRPLWQLSAQIEAAR